MGAIKDIYDILSEVTAKVQAHRLKKSKPCDTCDLAIKIGTTHILE